VPRETLVGVLSEFLNGNVPNTNFECCHYRKLLGKCCDFDNMHIKRIGYTFYVHIISSYFTVLCILVHTHLPHVSFVSY